MDYLKLCLAVLVAFAHTSWMQTNTTPLLFVLGNGLMRLIVPLFCIVTGYFLQSAVARGKGRQWLWRVFLLYAFWMLLYLPFWLGEVHGLLSLVKVLVRGYFHLWFMAGILLAGLMILGLRAIGERWLPGWHRLLVLAAAVCAVIGVGLQYVDLSGIVHVGAHKYANGLFACFPFVSIGYLCGRRAARPGSDWPGKDRRLLVAAIVGACLLMAEAWLVQDRWGVMVMLDIPLASYLTAPPLFLLILATRMPRPPIRLDPISAAIYFLHVMALQLARALGVTELAGLMLFALGLPTLVALACSRLPLPGLGTDPARHGPVVGAGGDQA
ncbi:acyltransferase family protein [Paracoccus sp. (in: a-proteobacteria)]|uniref:acyltransferase family protein n=1 Tax=Paracoccus sp. TaxID=267 RepID=UPI0032200497